MRVLAILCVAVSLLAGCFDSRWTTAPATQRAAAQKLAPSTARPTEKTGASPLRSLRVRVWAHRSHVSAGVDWRARLRELIADANRTLARDLDAKLEIASAASWPAVGGNDDLETWLTELEAHDDGHDVDWVIGLVGGTPKLELSFHELGVGRMLGKHVVLRSLHDEAEWQDVERSLDALDEGERRKLLAERRRHRAASVLVHELAHTLGVPHVKREQTLMSRRYHAHADGLPPAAVRLMRTALAHRAMPIAERDIEGMTQALLAELNRADAGWVEAERDALVDSLSGARPPEPQPAASPPKVASKSAPTNLSKAERDLFSRAEAELASGRASEAWRSAEPLFGAYPDDYAVQDLRCRIAMRAGFDHTRMRSECAPLMKLNPGVPGWN